MNNFKQESWWIKRPPENADAYSIWERICLHLKIDSTVIQYICRPPGTTRIDYYGNGATFLYTVNASRISVALAAEYLGLIEPKPKPSDAFLKEETTEEQPKPPSAEINVNNNISLEHAACIIAAGLYQGYCDDNTARARYAIALAQEIFKQCKTIKDNETISGESN